MNLNEARQKMGKTIDALHQQLLGVRSSQVNPSLVGSIKVVYNGRPTPIGHLGTATRNKTNVSVTIWQEDDKGLLGRIEKALQGAGLNAYKFSKDTVCVTVEQYGDKTNVIAHIKKAGEEAKVAIRNIRKTVRQKHKKDLSEIDKPLEKMTSEFINEVDEFVTRKINSL